MLVLGGEPPADLPLMLTEFGGIAVSGGDDGQWGYSVVSTPEELAAHYEKLLAVVRTLGLLSGFCYTQFADTYQEANGLLRADRSPKIPIRTIAAATTGWDSSRLDEWSQRQ